MPETLNIPDDLAACQQLVRELIEANRRLQKIHEELLATCTSVQDSRLKLQQQKEELEQTIKELMHRMYGRRSERHIGSPDQLSLDFGEGEHVAVIPGVTDDETFVVEHEEKKKRRKKKNTGMASKMPQKRRKMAPRKTGEQEMPTTRQGMLGEYPSQARHPKIPEYSSKVKQHPWSKRMKLQRWCLT